MYLGHGNRFVGGHLHTIGNRCWCGYLTVPVRFHERDDKGKVTKEGEEQYLRWLASAEKPGYVNPPVMAEIKRTAPPPIVGTPPTGVTTEMITEPKAVTKTCNTCGRAVTGRKVCNACRQAAYRERKGS